MNGRLGSRASWLSCLVGNYACSADLLERSGYRSKGVVTQPMLVRSCTFQKFLAKNCLRGFLQDVSVYFKLDLDDFPCTLLDSCFRYLKGNYWAPDLYGWTCKRVFFITTQLWVYCLQLSFLF